MLKHCVQLMPTLLKEEAETTGKDFKRAMIIAQLLKKHNFRQDT